MPKTSVPPTVEYCTVDLASAERSIADYLSSYTPMLTAREFLAAHPTEMKHMNWDVFKKSYDNCERIMNMATTNPNMERLEKNVLELAVTQAAEVKKSMAIGSAYKGACYHFTLTDRALVAAVDALNEAKVESTKTWIVYDERSGLVKNQRTGDIIKVQTAHPEFYEGFKRILAQLNSGSI